MVDRTPLCPVLTLLLCFMPFTFLSAQDTTEIPSAGEEAPATKDYYFELQEDGTPLFRQVISWEEIPNCLAYELVLEELGGEELLREKTEQDSVAISLPPGDYRYCIVVYNLLDKPELQTEWTTIIIRKAEIPAIENLSPSAIYMEEANFRVILQGDNLLPDAEYSLVDQKSGNKVLDIRETRREDDGTVVLILPERKIDFGDYLVKVVNPGGISDVSDTGFVVRYQKPVDLYVSVGYEPHVPLYDAWVLSNWDKPFYGGGAMIRAGMFVVKRRWGYIGPELFSHFLSMKGGTSEATINTFSMKLGLNGVYKYFFTPKFQGLVRIGGGVAINANGFSYEGTEGPELTSADFFLTTGVSLQYNFTRRFYADAGADWYQVFRNGYLEGSIDPFVSVGYSY